MSEIVQYAHMCVKRFIANYFIDSAAVRAIELWYLGASA